MAYYVHLGGENKGPFSLSELQNLVTEGVLLPTTYVVAEGAQKWIRASEIQGLFPSPAGLPPLPGSGAPPNAPIFTAEDVAKGMKEGAQKALQYSVKLTSQSTGFWGTVIKTTRSILNENFLQSVLHGLARSGIFAMVAAALGVLVASVALAAKFHSETQIRPAFVIGGGIVIVGMISLVQYFASRFMNSGEMVINSTPTKMGSDALTEAIALLSLIPAVILSAASVFFAIKFEQLTILFNGLAFFFSGSLTAGIALNPNMLNIGIDEKSSAGNAAIGIVSFYFKSALRSMPAVFGVMSISGTVAVVWGMLKVVTGDLEAGFISLLIGIVTVLGSGLLPVLGLLFFLFGHLSIDVISAILNMASSDMSGKSHPLPEQFERK